jgi:hypothetical protein
MLWEYVEIEIDVSMFFHATATRFDAALRFLYDPDGGELT